MFVRLELFRIKLMWKFASDDFQWRWHWSWYWYWYCQWENKAVYNLIVWFPIWFNLFILFHSYSHLDFWTSFLSPPLFLSVNTRLDNKMMDNIESDENLIKMHQRPTLIRQKTVNFLLFHRHISQTKRQIEFFFFISS